MLKFSKLKLTAILLVFILLATTFTGCQKRETDDESSLSDTSSSSLPSHSFPEMGSLEWAPNLSALADEKYELNADTVGWLRLADTTIDDVVLWKEGDNDYYLRRNFEKRNFFNGVYYADKRAQFGDGTVNGLGRLTCIYGHSMSDSKDDVKFGPMRYYLDEEYALNHPYIYFSTLSDDLAWEVVSIFYTHFETPYNRNDLSDEEFDKMLDEVFAKSIYNYEFERSDDDRYLVLSTCIYSLPDGTTLDYPNAYRFGIMARLVGPDETMKETATFEKNPDIKKP